jgi:hypothetical protein
MKKEDLKILLDIGIKCSNEIRIAKKNPKRKDEMIAKIANELDLGTEQVEAAFGQADTMRSLYDTKKKIR